MVYFKEMKVNFCNSPSSFPILLTVEYTKAIISPIVELGTSTLLEVKDKTGLVVQFSSVNAICRFLARISGKLYGDTVLERTEVDHWLEFSAVKHSIEEFGIALEKLNKSLLTGTYLVGHGITLADICVWSMLTLNRQWHSLCRNESAPKNVVRWFNYLSSQQEFVAAGKLCPVDLNQERGAAKSQSDSSEKPTKTADQGKFVELPGAEMGKVVVRFPPEASGFLHIGHAKAALLNSYYQTNFEGQLIMRFDDTNPEKEKEDFEKVILEDVDMLEIKPDRFTYTSDHFDLILEKCEWLLKKGLAYVDDTDPETMKKEREQKLVSKNRCNSPEKNLSMWKEMKDGTEYGARCCVRAKIDMSSDNGCLRDPTLYRCKAVPHPRTGYKFKVYPTYDFACPIVDSVEGVTHALRTTEYHDRDEQYFWILSALQLRKPHIYEYSRLNMTNTVLSKRKLTWFVEQGLVEGWDDPRMPTVRGVLRRGMTVDGLKQFIVAQGSSRSVVMMEWDKIWAFNRKVIDPIAPRYNAVEIENAVPVFIDGVSRQTLDVLKHPKDVSLGTRKVHVGSKLLVDQADAKAMHVGQNVTFINWGNMLIKEVHKDVSGAVESVTAQTNLENKDFKKTLKVTWVADLDAPAVIPCVCVYYDHLISKSVLGKDEDFRNYINENTKVSVGMMGDPDLASLKKGDIIQIQRKGFFICDTPYDDSALRHTSREMPLVLISIPDGSRDTTVLPNAVKIVREKGESVKELSQRSKGKVAEKSPQEEGKTLAGIETHVETVSSLDERIKLQGDKIRKLKADKVAKATLGPEIQCLLDLKAKYKELSGKDWEPSAQNKPTGANSIPASTGTGDAALSCLEAQIREQGDKIRKLKAEKVAKATLDPEVNCLLELKSKYKKLTGKEWKPEVDKSNIVPKGEAKTNAEDSSFMLDSQIRLQGDKVRKMKGDKLSKDALDPEIKCLLNLKAQYKAVVGKDWTPTVPPNKDNSESIASPNSASCGQPSEMLLDEQIKKQGDKIRELKNRKCPKDALDPEIKCLLELKSEFKTLTGQDWQPSVALNLNTKCKAVVGKDWTPTVPPSNANSGIVASPNSASYGQPSEMSLDERIKKQGDKIRELKNRKCPKDVLDPEIKCLLELKSEFKTLTGQDWQPSVALNLNTKCKAVVGKDWTPTVPPSNANSESVASPNLACCDQPSETSLDERIKKQGDKIRDLKSGKCPKDVLDPEIKCLLELKSEFKTLTGQDWQPPVAQLASANKNNAKSASNKSEPRHVETSKKSEQSNKRLQSKDGEGKAHDSKKLTGDVSETDSTHPGIKKVTRLGLEVKKEENFAEWYSQVITKGEMIEYYDVSGCYVLRPWAFGIWEAITNFFDPAIKALGVSNCYFPMFVSTQALAREQTHIADFAPEVAWVTKSGDSDLAEPIAIRPTSETVMYPSYARWIRSHRDLPLQLNQWCSVVRWEFKDPQPFIRTREFLWQEGHTAFATREEAVKEVHTILELYAKIYEDLLAIPVIRGRKSEKEKFAGADFTTTIEAYVPTNGRAVQGATSHHLGQNFSRMFEIMFEHPETAEKQYVYQNSWGLTTRTIGVMVLVHGDNSGLVLPPRVAPHQVVIVPCGITASLSESEIKLVMDKCGALERELREEASVRVKGDYRENYSPGWKYNYWELKGVPIRIELGLRDIKKGDFVAVRRDTGEKVVRKLNDASAAVKKLLDDVHENLFMRAKGKLDDHLAVSFDFDDFCSKLDNHCIIQAPFCGEILCEEAIKKDSAKNADELLKTGAPSMGAKTLCIPFQQPGEITSDMKCINPACNNKPKYFTLFGRSY